MPIRSANRGGWVELIAPASGQRTAQVSHVSRSAMRCVASADPPSESDLDGTVLSYFGIRFTEMNLEDGEGLYIRAVRSSGSVQCDTFPVAGSSSSLILPDTGWADFVDTQYTSESPFAVSSNTDTILPNNGLGGPKQNAPSDVTLFSGGKVYGVENDSMLITMSMVVERQSNNGEFDFEAWWDIGGSVGELYRRYYRVRGDQPRTILSTTMVYCLDTWAANGATTYVRSSEPLNIHTIRHVINRVLPAP